MELNLIGAIMDLSPNERAALNLAGLDQEGRIIAIDPNIGPLEVIGPPGNGHIVLGESSLHNLLGLGLLKSDGASSYLLTNKGWKVIGKEPK